MPQRRTRAGFTDARQVAVADDFHFRVFLVEVDNVAFERFPLRVCSGVLRRFAVGGTAASVNNMPRHTVVTSRAVCYFPRVHECVLVVPDQPLHRAVQVEKVCISDLTPAPAAL